MANEKRLIDANALTHFVEERTGSVWIYKPDFLWAVTQQPTVDAVEVVRCRDCIYYEIGKDYLPYCNHADGGIADYPQENDFCSYGERKDDDTERSY